MRWKPVAWGDVLKPWDLYMMNGNDPTGYYDNYLSPSHTQLPELITLSNIGELNDRLISNGKLSEKHHWWRLASSDQKFLKSIIKEE